MRRVYKGVATYGFLFTIGCGGDGGSTTPQPVTPPPQPLVPGSIEVAPSQVTVLVPSTSQVTATVKSTSGREMPNEPVVWSITPREFASISTSGSITATSEGEGTVTARSGSLSASVPLTVRDDRVARLIADSMSFSLPLGTSRIWAVRAENASGRRLASAPISYSSSNAGRVSVDSTGRLTAVTPGAATITAQSGARMVFATVIVGDTDPALVEVSPADVTLFPTATRRLSVRVIARGGTPVLSPRLRFSSETPAIATVDAFGTITGVTVGRTRVLVQADSAVGSAEVTVTDTVVRLDVSAQSFLTSLHAGDSLALVARGITQSGARIALNGVAWTSSEPQFAAITSRDFLRHLPGTAAGARTIRVNAGWRGLTGSGDVRLNGWSFRASQDRVSLDSLFVLEKAFGEFGMMLRVSCQQRSKQFSASVTTGGRITRSGSVTYRITGLPSVSATWGESVGFTALFAPSPRTFVSQVAVSDSLLFRASTLEGVVESALLVRDMRSYLPRVESPCS